MDDLSSALLPCRSDPFNDVTDARLHLVGRRGNSRPLCKFMSLVARETLSVKTVAALQFLKEARRQLSANGAAAGLSPIGGD